MPEKSEAMEYKAALNKGFMLALVHLLFLGFLVFTYYSGWQGKVDPKAWVYGGASVVSVLFLSAVTIIFKDGNFFKNLCSLICSAVNVFLLPMAFYAKTKDLNSTLYFAVLFQMFLIAMSRLEGVVLVAISGSVFLSQINLLMGETLDVGPKFFLAYCVVFVTALVWRLLARRLYFAFLALNEKTRGEGEKAYQEKIQELEGERNLLRSELVKQVVEMKEFMSEQNLEERSRES